MTWSFKGTLLVGLAGILWFSSLFHAAHDLWSASVVFFLTTSLVTVYAVRCWKLDLWTELPFGPFVLAVAVALWLSLRHSYDLETTLLDCWGWTFAFCLFYLLFNIIEHPADLDTFFVLAGTVLIPLTYIGVRQQITGHPDSWGHWEIHATLINSLVLAGFCLNWVFIFWDKAIQHRPIESLLFCLSLLLLILSRSWWAAVCLTAGSLLYYRTLIQGWYRYHRRVIVGLAGLGIVLLIGLIMTKYRAHGGPYKESSRLYYWWVALQAWKREPWTGIGLGGYATVYPYYRSRLFQSTLYAHSFPLSWLCETGILGTLALLFFVGNANRKSADATISNSSITALEATLLSLVLFSFLGINLEYLLNQILIALIVAAWVWRRHPKSFRIKPLWVMVFSASLWLLSPFWMRQFLASQKFIHGVNSERSGNFDEAEHYYLDAISMDPLQADSYHALAMLHWHRFQMSSRIDQRQIAYRCMEEALKYHRDPIYLAELDALGRSRPTSERQK